MTRAWPYCWLVWLLVLLAPAWAAAAEPNWIWSPPGVAEKEPSGPCFFRHVFLLRADPIKTAQIEIAAHDQYQLFVNGQAIGHGSNPQQFDRYELKQLLTDGQNVIAIEASHRGDLAGLVVRLRVDHLNVTPVDVTTDRDWKTSRSAAEGWNRLKFADDAWKPAHVSAPLGNNAPWGPVAAAAPLVASVEPPKVRKIHKGPPEKFDLRDGDRVVLLGNTLIEREQKYGYLETALTERFPDRNITFRNLGWSGDTVWGEARAEFGTQADGFRALKEHVLALKPTVILVGYGTNESFAGPAGLPHFIDGLNTLLDTLDETDARIVILSPLHMEKLGPPLPDPEQQNKNLEIYSKALEQVAGERGCIFVDLGMLPQLRPVHEGKVGPPDHLTDDEIHLTQVGYSYFASVVEYFVLPNVPPRGLHISIDSARKIEQSGMLLVDFKVEHNAVRFTCTDKMLPYPSTLPKEAKEAPKGVCADSEFQVIGQSAGRYQLTIDGKPVFNGTADELAKGVFFCKGPSFDQAEELRQAVIRKNELYFNRWRPQNVTYLFLFRRNEQGQNAVEIPKFDPLIAEAEQQIAKLRVPQPHVFELKPVEEKAK